MADFIPDRGNLVWIDFNPQSGHEQAGRRPALILSPASYNAKTGMAIACPITSKAKGYPFEVKIRGKISGVVLSDHVRNIDWQARNATLAGQISEETVVEVVRKLSALIL